MKTRTLLLLLFLPMLSFTQTVTVSESVNIRNDLAYYLIGELKGNQLLFRERANDFEVQCFNEKLQLTWKKEIILDKKRPEIIEVFTDKKEFFNVVYQYKLKGKTTLKVHKYNAGANLIDSITIKNFGSMLYSPNFKWVLSENKENVLIYFVENQKEITALSFNLTNSELLWEKKFQPGDFFYGRDFREIVVDNEGNMYVILEKDNRKLKQEEHRLRVLVYRKGKSEKLTLLEVPMKDYLTYDSFFSFDNLNKKLMGGGFFSLENLSRAEGYYFLNIDPERPDNHQLVFHKFPDEFVASLMDKQKDKTKNKGIPEANVKEIVLRRDGGFLLVGELNKKFERRGSGAGTVGYGRGNTHFITDYYYDDLFVLSLHPSGETHWDCILHKKQYSQDDGAIFSSYFLAKTASALRFIFNDEIKYENTVSEYIVKGNGEFDRNSVMSTESQLLRLRFRDALQVAADEIIVPSERRGRLKLVRVKY